MAHLNQYNEQWLQHAGKTVVIGGLKHRIEVNTYRAIYPYEHTVISVHAVPVSKHSKHYKEVKQQLGDDWSTDILESDVELQTEVLRQL
jgi:hypothetical protein